MTFRLLFADDSATMHRVVEITVAQESIELLAARDGREALTQSRQSIPDAALIDVHMPEMDGYEVCQELKRDPRTAHVPVLLLFSSQHPLDEARAQAVGAAGSISKPFESQALLDKLAQVLGVPHASAMEASSAQRHEPARTPEPSSSYQAVPPSPAAQVPLASADERPSFFGGAPRPTASEPLVQTTVAQPQPSAAPTLALGYAPPEVHATRGQPAPAPSESPTQPFVAPPNEDITLVGARPMLAPRERAVSRVVHIDAPVPGAPPPQRLSNQPSGPASGAAAAWLRDTAQAPGGLPSREALSSESLAGLPELPSWDAPYAPRAAPLATESPMQHAAYGLSSFAPLEPPAPTSAPTPEAPLGAAHDEGSQTQLRAWIREEITRQLPEALMAYLAQLSDEQRAGLLEGSRASRT